jgi:hypothetical protein
MYEKGLKKGRYYVHLYAYASSGNEIVDPRWVGLLELRKTKEFFYLSRKVKRVILSW